MSTHAVVMGMEDVFRALGHNIDQAGVGGAQPFLARLALLAATEIAPARFMQLIEEAQRSSQPSHPRPSQVAPA